MTISLSDFTNTKEVTIEELKDIFKDGLVYIVITEKECLTTPFSDKVLRMIEDNESEDITVKYAVAVKRIEGIKLK